MTRIHITASGKAAPCTASLRTCPRGGSDQHFDSMKEAVLAMAERGRGHGTPRQTSATLRTAFMAANEAFLTEHGAAVNTFRNHRGEVEMIVSWKNEHGGTEQRTYAPGDDIAAERGQAFATVEARVGRDQLAVWRQAQEEAIPCTQQEVNDLAFEELRKAGLLSEGWTVAHGHQVNALATTFYGTKQIQFSKLWTPVLSREEMRDTITHEVAHAKVGTGHGHDETWQAAHRAMGGSGEEKHHSEDPQQRVAYRERFKKFYPKGLKGGTRGGVGKKELDPAMIEALKAKYLKKFKMPFDESGLSVPELLQMAQKGELD